MYTSFYNLSEMPFTISTDPRFLWLGEKHQEALANLKYGLLEANGYVVLTGDVGVGKTTLVNALLDNIEDSVLTANISHPTLSTIEFFRFIARTWDGPAKLDDKIEFLFFFKEFLLQARAEGKTVLLIIDEAHRLSEELLEEIRLLSNLEHQGDRLFNIFFVGQDELKEMLMSSQFRALRQRITLFYDIKPLSREETKEYIKHRLRIAGGDCSLFSEGAIGKIQHFSKGYPRLINTLCGRAMLTGFIQDRQAIDAAIVTECCKELDFLDPATAPNRKTGNRTANRDLPPSASAQIKQQTPPEATVQQNSNIGIPPKSLVKNQATLMEKAKGFLRDLELLVKWDQWQSWLPLPANRGKVLAFLAFAGIVGIYSFSDRNGLLAGLEVEKAKPPEIIDVPDVSSSAAESVKKPLPAQEQTAIEPGNNKDNIAAGQIQPEAAARTESGKEETTLQQEDNNHDLTGPARKQTGRSLPAEVPTLLELASAALEKQQYQTVIDLMEAENIHFGEQPPDYAKLYTEALVGKAEQLISTSPKESEDLLRRAVEVDATNSRAFFLLGKLLTRNKEYASAIAAYQRAGSLNPVFADPFFNLGFLYATTGMYEKSEQFFQHAVDLKPAYLGKAFFNLAVIQERLGKLEASYANLHRARELDPENEKVKNYLQKATAAREGRQ